MVPVTGAIRFSICKPEIVDIQARFDKPRLPSKGRQELPIDHALALGGGAADACCTDAFAVKEAESRREA